MKKGSRAKPKPSTRKSVMQPAIRMDVNLRDRIVEHHKRMEAEKGYEISISEVIRKLIEKGLEAVS
jgi:dTDP-glucose pyrophosphorylase